jgi:transposase
VRRREVPDPGVGPDRADAADAAGDAPARDPRLLAQRHLEPVRRAGRRQRQVIRSLHSRHRSIEFKKFLVTIDQQVPAELDVHLILDNYATHKTPQIKRWLAAHPRFHLHFTPTGASWLNLVERWFGELTARLLRHGVHRSVRELNADIQHWVDHWNEHPKPFVWTKTAEQIFETLAAYCKRITDSGH